MKNLLEEVESLQHILVSKATGGNESEEEFANLRKLVLSQEALTPYIPRFLKTCRSLGQFWQYIKNKYGSYAERRSFIWKEFQPLLELLEQQGLSPSDQVVTNTIQKFDSENIQIAWSKALERRVSDPEGAITMARTLLESVCKHVLDESGIAYEDSPDLNKLYRQTSEHLNLAPSQHTEKIFKQILGGCTSVIEGLGALRNKFSDSHGRGKVGVKPASRHAELAVNLAGTLATYILATWETKI